MSMSWLLKACFPGLFSLLVVSGFSSCSNVPASVEDQTPSDHSSPPVYAYKIDNVYPHDEAAFTQGLTMENGTLYEGTGLYGKSSLRKVDLATGRVLQIYELPDEYFGEGITVFKDTIIQLTWQANTGFVYERDSFDLLSHFRYETEGWGITHDGEHLIMSDGTSTLYILDPMTFGVINHIEVQDNDTPVNRLNELEYINGRIYANVWQTDKIAIINPQDGQVTGWIDLSGLLQSQGGSTSADVLNGIAYDAANDRLFVAGKLWPWLFEIELMARN
jgi:glutamine cyclotransferase